MKKNRRDLQSQGKDRVQDKGDPSVSCGFRHVILFGCGLWIYVYTVFPSITGGDAGELLAEACHFGIPHPPGYPLFTVLHFMLSRAVRTGEVLGTLPVRSQPTECLSSTPGTQALAANLLATTLGATTAVLITLAIEEWTIGSKMAYNRGAAATGALLFCFSPVVWEYSTGAEVFVLNNTLVSLALVIAARVARRPSVKEANIGVLVFGLAVTNQHSAVIVMGPLALLVIFALNRKHLLSWHSMALWGGFWLPVGLSPYFYFVLSSQNPQQGSWGDLTSIRGMVRHFLREEYGTLNLGISTPNCAGTLERIREYLGDTIQQTTTAGPLLALLGIAWALLAPTVASGSPNKPHEAKRMRLFGIGLAAAWAIYVLVWHGVFSNISLQHPMSRAVHSRFWMQPNLLLCVAAGAGIGIIMNAIISLSWRCWPRCLRSKQWMFGVVISFVFPVFAGAGVIWARWEKMNRGTWSGGDSAGWTMHLYGQAMLSSMPVGAYLLSHTDLDLNPARYLRGEYRTCGRESEGNAALVGRFLAANLPLGRAIFLDMQAVNEREIGTVGEWRGFSLVPHGLTYRVLPRMSPYESERWHKEIIIQLNRLKSCMKPAPTEKYPPGTWEFGASSVYWDAHYQAALFFLSYAIAVSGNTPAAQQRPYTLPALQQAADLLLRTLDATDAHGTFSSARADLLKNAALAQIRLHHALRVALALAKKNEPSVQQRMNQPIPLVVENMVKEMLWAKEQCLRLIPRFLLESENDKDAEAFGKEYIKFRGSG